MIHVTWLGIMTCFWNWRRTLGLFGSDGTPVKVEYKGVWFCGELIVPPVEGGHTFFGVEEAHALSIRLNNIVAVKDKDFVRFEKWPTCPKCAMKLEAVIMGLYS